MKRVSSLFRIVVTAFLLYALSAPDPLQARPFKKEPRLAHSQNRTFGAFFQPKSYDLPYSDWEFRPPASAPRRFFGSHEPAPETRQLVTVIRERAEVISQFGLTYKFGGDHPTEGGMDCSGTMKYMLSGIGFDAMPRTSYHQYEWLKKARTLNHTKTIPERAGGRKGIRPGDLIFWGGTYNSGHKVSHVMIYLGQSDDGTHYMFGARGKKKRGLHGNGVDIFKLSSGYQKSLIGYGSLPGAI